MTRTFASIAAAALISVAAIPAQAALSTTEVLELDLTPAVVETAAVSTAQVTLDEFIDGLKDKRDDGTLNPEDYRKIRQFQSAEVTLDEFIDGLKDKRDDGTLNPEDYRKIRQFQSAEVTLDEFIDNLKDKRDDGTLNPEDFRRIRNFQA